MPLEMPGILRGSKKIKIKIKIMILNDIKKSRGVSLLELLVVVGVVSIGLVYLLGIFSFALKIAASEKLLIQANFLAEEAMEGVRNFRDRTNWHTDGLGVIDTSTVYHLEKTGLPPEWNLISGEKTIDGFTQKIVFDDVRRDSNDDITESGGTIDSNTKKITITISWQERGEDKEIELVGFLTNWK